MTTFVIQRHEIDEIRKEIFFEALVTLDTEDVFSFGRWITNSNDYYFVIEDVENNLPTIVSSKFLAEAIRQYQNTPPANLWHDNNSVKQIEMTQQDNLKLLTLYPLFAVYCQQEGIQTYMDYGNTYTYVNYIAPEHQAMFDSAEQQLGIRIRINEKPI